MKLNLGCGFDYREGWLNLDVDHLEKVDIVHDVNNIPLPFEDDKFEYILCKDILEHVDLIPVLNDLHRILKKNGILRIRVPHFTSISNYDDPTHQNQFSVRTFNYFVKDFRYSYNRNVKNFSKISKIIRFHKKQNFLMKFVYKFLEKWVNKSNKRQNFYENSFLRIFPAANIEIILIK